MRDRIRQKLRSILNHLEAGTAKARLDEDRVQLNYLRSQLAAIEQDEATLDAMLNHSRDSFHHGLASATTTHVESNSARLDSIRERIEELEERLAGHRDEC